jgi:hypothetical protein
MTIRTGVAQWQNMEPENSDTEDRDQSVELPFSGREDDEGIAAL